MRRRTDAMTPKALGEVAGLWTLVAASLADWLPIVAAGLASVWTIILIGGWLGFWKRPFLAGQQRKIKPWN